MQYIIKAHRVKNILSPHALGKCDVIIKEHMEQDGTKTASISFDGSIQGFVTYGANNSKAVSCTQLGISHTLDIETSLMNICRVMK